jgi:PLP dependent protein
VIERALAEQVSANLSAVRSRVERTALSTGRRPTDIRLVAISKTFGPDHVRAAFTAGQREFGENRVQEALAKKEATADLPIRWHLVGHLQSNKARKAIGPFSCIQSVDSVDLLRRIEAAAADAGQQVDLLFQVDLAGELTKFGAPVGTLAALFDAALACRVARIVGLMVLPPFFDSPAQARPYFRRLRELRDEWLGRGVPPGILQELSMGMSHDFEVAIEEGATIVRVGTAVFGARPPLGTASEPVGGR